MGEALGLTVADLDEGWRPLNLVAVVESIDLTVPDTGPRTKRLSTRATEDLDLWTAIGMLEAALADLKQQYVNSLEEEP